MSAPEYGLVWQLAAPSLLPAGLVRVDALCSAANWQFCALCRGTSICGGQAMCLVAARGGFTEMPQARAGAMHTSLARRTSFCPCLLVPGTHLFPCMAVLLLVLLLSETKAMLSCMLRMSLWIQDTVHNHRLGHQRFWCRVVRCMHHTLAWHSLCHVGRQLITAGKVQSLQPLPPSFGCVEWTVVC